MSKRSWIGLATVIVLAIPSCVHASCSTLSKNGSNWQRICPVNRYDPNTGEQVANVKMCNAAGTACYTQGWATLNSSGGIDGYLITYNSNGTPIGAVNGYYNGLAAGSRFFNFSMVLNNLPIQGAGNVDYNEQNYAQQVYDSWEPTWMDRSGCTPSYCPQ